MTLYVFALNTPVSVTLTDLTRARGEVAGLPPLGDWLGLTALDTDRIELFSIADLGELPLSSYLARAYDASLQDHATRLDALDGAVLLVPDRAMTGEPDPGPEATLIATLPTAQADHAPKLEPHAAPPHTKSPAVARPEEKPARPLGWIVAIALALAAVALWWAT